MNAQPTNNKKGLLRPHQPRLLAVGLDWMTPTRPTTTTSPQKEHESARPTQPAAAACRRHHHTTASLLPSPTHHQKKKPSRLVFSSISCVSVTLVAAYTTTASHFSAICPTPPAAYPFFFFLFPLFSSAVCFPASSSRFLPCGRSICSLYYTFAPVLDSVLANSFVTSRAPHWSFLVRFARGRGGVLWSSPCFSISGSLSVQIC